MTDGRLHPIVPHPPAPPTLAAAGVSLDLVVQLALKTLHFTGELIGTDWASRLGVRFVVIEPAIELLKKQHQVEIVGGSMLGGSSYRYRITDAGRARAALFLEQSHYVGTIPVPLAQYQAYMHDFERAAPKTANRERLREAFAHLVIGDRVLDRLGPAINAHHSMFVYGPPGNGKTVIAQAIGNLLDGEIAIPHALEVEGEIIRFYDPVVHQALPDEEEPETALDSARAVTDARWVRCRRPLVMVGGELTLESLELVHNPISGFYRAPIQAIANGGVLVIDDFGRQQCAPRQLLNRWIVPLESRVDYLTLKSGQKFEMPFNVLLVLATNLKPSELVDEAFLRRIQYKVMAESPSAADFIKIFENCCRDRSIPFDRQIVEGLLQGYFAPRRVALRGCQPRDLIDQALSLAQYLSHPRVLTAPLLEAACATYFVDDEEAATAYA